MVCSGIECLGQIEQVKYDENSRNSYGGRVLAEVQEKIVDSWDELVKIAKFVDVGQLLTTAYVFRGQGQDLPLVPRLTRQLTPEMSLHDIYSIERNAQTIFEQRAHLYLPHGLSRIDPGDPMNVVLMQHYGIPTRLLDWTQSIFVAAYFAVSESADTGSDGVVWLMHVQSFREASRDVYGEYTESRSFERTYQLEDNPPDLSIVSLRREPPRMASQQSVLTISRDPRSSHEAVIAKLVTKIDRTDTVAAKLIIKSSAKEEIYRQLHSANVNASTLFPGLDGLGRSIAESVERSINFRVNEIRSYH